MAFRIEGAGQFYTFPSNFDLRDYNRDVHIPQRPVHGADGAKIDTSAVRRRVLQVVLSGFIQEASVSATLAERDKMESAINAVGDEVYLVDTVANRRVAVKLRSAVIPREPVARLTVTLFFTTSDDPYWQETGFVSAVATDAHWQDLAVGEAGSWSEMVMGGFVSHPTVVHGNWSFCSHMDSNQATALNSAESNNPFGQVTGTFRNQLTFNSSGKFSTGLGLFGNNDQDSGDKLNYFSRFDEFTPASSAGTLQNPESVDRINIDQFTVTGWVNTQWEWNDGDLHYFFAAENPTLSLSKSAQNRLVAHYGDQSISYDASALRANQFYFVGLRGSRDSAIESDFLSLFVQGTLQASLSTQPNTFSQAPARLHLGTNTLGQKSGDFILDDFAMWDIPLQSSAIVGTLYNSNTGRRAVEYLPHGLKVYAPFDSAAGSPVITGTGEQTKLNLFAQRQPDVELTAISPTTVSVRKNADRIFKDNQRVVLFDETGYTVQGWVNGNAASTLINIDNASGASVANAKKVGVFAEFDGEQQAQLSGSTLNLNAGANDIEFGFWFRRDGNPANAEGIVDKRGDFASVGYQIYVSSAGSLVSRFDDGTNDANFYADLDGFLDNRWHHAWVFGDRSDISTSKVNLDARAQSLTVSGTMPTLTLDNAQNLTVGAISGGTLEFAGALRDVRVKIGGTESTGTQARWQASHPRDYSGSAWSLTGTREYWEFSDSSGSTVSAGVTSPGNDLALSTSDQWRRVGYISRNRMPDHQAEFGGLGGFSPNTDVTVQKVTFQSGRAVQIDNPASGGQSFEKELDLNQNEDIVWRGFFNMPSFTIANPEVSLRIGGVQKIRIINPPTDVRQFWETCFDSDVTNGEKTWRFECVKSTVQFMGMELIDNLVQNGGVDKWTGTQTLTSWTETENGSSVIKRDLDEHSGDFAALASVDASNSTAMIAQSVSVATNQWYHVGFWAKADSVTGTPQVDMMENIGQSAIATHSFTLQTGYQRYTRFLKGARAGNATIRFKNGTGGANRQIFIDDISVTEMVGVEGYLTADGNSNPRIQPLKYGFGRNMIGDVFTYPSLVQRPDKLAAMVRFRASSAWSTLANSEPDKYLFDFARGTASLASHHLSLSIQAGRYVFGNSVSTIGAQATAYAIDKDMDVGFWLNTNGTVSAGGTTFRAKLFENGIELASTATFAALPISTLTHLWIGTNKDEAKGANQKIDEVYFWHSAQSDSFIKGEQNAQRRLSPDNQSFGYAASIPTPDYVFVNHEDSTVKLMNSSGPTITNEVKNMRGQFFKVGETNSHNAGNEIVVFSPQKGYSRMSRYRKRHY